MTDADAPQAAPVQHLPATRPPFWAVWRWQLHWQILIGLIVGIILGLATGQAAVNAARAAADDPTVTTGLAKAAQAHLRQMWLFMGYDLIGDLFLNGLKLIVVPIIMASLITSVAGIGQRKGFGRLGGKTLLYYGVTSLLAILVGLFLVNTIQPGIVASGEPVLSIDDAESLRGSFSEEASTLDQRTEGKSTADFLDTFRAMVPPNIIAAAAEGQLLGLIIVSLLIGYFLSRLKGEPQHVMLRFWEAVYAITLSITDVVLRFAPIGVAGLLAATLSDRYAFLSLDDRLTDFIEIIIKFTITTLLALGVHFFLTLPLMLLFFGRVKPWRHYRAMAPALMTAFSTASSSATLPVTMECVEERAGVSKRTTSFVLPLGATVNMDGTALYECVAALFIAQVYGIELTIAQQFFVVVVALLTSIGVAGVPSASLVAIVIILKAVGVPLEGLAIILVVDRLLDMCRTAVNIFSDSCGAVIIAVSEGETNLLPDNPVDPSITRTES